MGRLYNKVYSVLFAMSGVGIAGRIVPSGRVEEMAEEITDGLKSQGVDGTGELTDVDMYQSFTRTTAIYPESGTGSVGALAYVALGLAGEAGEVANKVKKLLRDEDTPERRQAVRDELNDVCWYLARACDELGVTLGDVMSDNVAKLSSRKERGVLGGSGDKR